MVQLLKMKEQILRFVSRYEVYVMALIRFVIALTAFTLINRRLGYMEALREYPVALIFALLSSFLPSGMMMFLGAVMILAHFYVLSLELCAIAALLFLVLFCLYLRFSVQKGLYVMLTPVLGVFGIPYVMPVSVGLLSKPYTAVSVVCGTSVFFFLRNVEENAALFTEEGNITRKSVFALAVNQLFGDKEMYLYLVVFAVTAIIVYCVSRLKIDHARMVAVVLGVAVQLVAICAGEIYLGNGSAVVRVIIGCIASALILLGVDFMSMSLDYSRVENTQFEDDEYYYYVRAVPKSFVPADDIQVKKINSRRTKSRKPVKIKKR